MTSFTILVAATPTGVKDEVELNYYISSSLKSNLTYFGNFLRKCFLFKIKRRLPFLWVILYYKKI